MVIPISELVLTTMKSIDSTNSSGALESINKFLSDWVGLVVVVTGGILSIISFIYNRRRDKLNGLFEVFKILNDNMHREARRVIHTGEVTQATRQILGFDADIDEKEVRRVCRDMVGTDMDQIGTMAQNKLFYENVFLQRYSTSIILEWRELREYIQSQRKARQTRDYMLNFEYLKNAAVKYRRKFYMDADPEMRKYIHRDSDPEMRIHRDTIDDC